MKTERFKPFAAVYLILEQNGNVLLLRRFNTGYQDGNYSLVAGHIDGAETTAECMAREAKEEIGITIDPKDLQVVHMMHKYRPDREYFDIYLRATTWLGEVTNMEPEKCDDLSWFSLGELPENILPEVRYAIEQTQKNIFYSELGWETR